MRTSVFTCLWPGLASLWLRGEARGLASALCFATLLNSALVASFVWPDLLGNVVRDILWLAVAIVWIISTWSNWRILPPRMTAEAGGQEGEDLFIRAQAEYLNGHWVEAHTKLARLLQLEPRDADARLMLSTLYRHTGRFEEARQQLDQLERQAVGNEKWKVESAFERHRIEQLEQQSKNENSSEEQLLSENENNEPAYSGNEQVAADETDVFDAA